MNQLQGLMKDATSYLVKHSAGILTGCGIAGVITTAVMAVKATPKALDDISIAEEAKGEPLTKIEIIKATWKNYVPATAIGGATIGCFVGAQSINARKQLALATLYTVTNDNFKTYREAVDEKIGEKKAKEIKDEAARRSLESNPISPSTEVIVTDGSTLCYDAWSGRYFKSSMEKIQGAINALNRDLNRDLFVSLNDLYFLLGLPSIKPGDMLGFTEQVDVYFSSQIAENNEPCLVMNFYTDPSDRYFKD